MAKLFLCLSLFAVIAVVNGAPAPDYDTNQGTQSSTQNAINVSNGGQNSNAIVTSYGAANNAIVSGVTGGSGTVAISTGNIDTHGNTGNVVNGQSGYIQNGDQS